MPVRSTSSGSQRSGASGRWSTSAIRPSATVIVQGPRGTGLSAVQAGQAAQVSARRRGGQRVGLVDMAEQPAVEAGALELGSTDRRVGRIGACVPVAVQEAQVDAGRGVEGQVGKGAREDPGLRKRPAPQRHRVTAVADAARFPLPASPQQPEPRDVAGEPGQHHHIVVAGDADDVDVRVGQPPHAVFERPVRLEEVVVPVDDVPGEQHRPHLEVQGGVHGPAPAFGGAEIRCVQLRRQPRRRAAEVHVADREDLHGKPPDLMTPRGQRRGQEHHPEGSS